MSPEISLAEADIIVGQARHLIRHGKDPVAERTHRRREAAAAAEPFQNIAEKWMNNPAAPFRGTFKVHKPQNFAALTRSQEFGELIARIRTYDGSPVTRSALLLMAYTFVRTGELRHAHWSEFDLDGSIWRIPTERMKMGMDRQHVTLRNSPQELCILRRMPLSL